MNPLRWISESFKGNPLAWLLVGVVVLAEWGNYENGHNLTTVCENLADMIREPPLNAPRALMAAWQRKEAAEIEKICAGQMSEPAPRDP